MNEVRWRVESDLSLMLSNGSLPANCEVSRLHYFAPKPSKLEVKWKCESQGWEATIYANLSRYEARLCPMPTKALAWAYIVLENPPEEAMKHSNWPWEDEDGTPRTKTYVTTEGLTPTPGFDKLWIQYLEI
jgi:hypothetical protein